MKFGQNVYLDETSDKFESGSCGITRSHLIKPCVSSRGHIFSPIHMKLGQNVCLNEILDMFENVLCGVKKPVHLVKS